MSIKDTSNNAYLKSISIFLGFICFVLIIFILVVLKSILIPFIVAIFLTFLSDPILKYFSRRKIPKALSIIILLIIFLSINYLFGLAIYLSVSHIPEKIPFYSQRLSEVLKNLLSPFNITSDQFFNLINQELQKYDLKAIVKGIFNSGIISQSISSVSTFVGDTFLVIVFWLFMIAGKKQFENKFNIAFTNRGKAMVNTFEKIIEQTQSYIFVKTAINLVNGFLCTLVFLIFGLDYAILWGVLIFAFNYIPNIGPTIAIIFPILISLIQFGISFQSIAIIILLILIQFIEGNYFEPKFMGKFMDLSPVYVLFSLIFWGWIWGIPGMFLAIPIAVVIKILFSNITPLQPISIFLGSYKDALSRMKQKNSATKTSS